MTKSSNPLLRFLTPAVFRQNAAGRQWKNAKPSFIFCMSDPEWRRWMGWRLDRNNRVTTQPLAYDAASVPSVRQALRQVCEDCRPEFRAEAIAAGTCVRAIDERTLSRTVVQLVEQRRV